MKLALAFSSKDRIDLSMQSIQPLIGLPDTDIFWLDGSTGEEGQMLPAKVQRGAGENHHIYHHPNVRGGADAAIVYALTVMLAGQDYTHVGLVENDVLLPLDWLRPTLELFERGREDGLAVGAVSTRCYEDRILCQRDGYALMHNLGAGQVVFTRQAAQLVLDNFRTTYTTENRKLFAQLCGKDIGSWWAFRASEHWLTADWAFDKVLSSHGLASLALTPSPTKMLDQDPALVGLKIVTEPCEALRDDRSFDRYVELTRRIRDEEWVPNPCTWHHDGTNFLIFPHQLPQLGATYEGDWQLKWQQGFGPFAWKAASLPTMAEGWKDAQEGPKIVSGLKPAVVTIPLLGPCSILVGGGAKGGKVEVIDEGTGLQLTPTLQPEGAETSVLSIDVPAGCIYRNVKLTMLTPGVTFYGIKMRDPQPWLPQVKFDHSVLPPV